MIALGITGTFDRVHETAFFTSGIHDASAAIVSDGEIVAAVEEERFNRFKHSGKMPEHAIRYCLDAAGVGLDAVDAFVFNISEANIDRSLEAAYRAGKISGRSRSRPYIQRLLRREFGCDVDPCRFEFVDHHYAHAASAFFPSGFSESLVVTLDGVGEGVSGTAWWGHDGHLELRRTYTGLPEATTQSIGHFYTAITTLLGFTVFDEYKVMGLAPYGDRCRLRSVFERFYTLGDAGDYQIHLSRLDELETVCAPRRKCEPIEQVHKDVAAALQEAVERIASHVLVYHQRETGARRLCLAGGVAHNCTLNGRILRSGLFEEVFVQPASHDGGLSLGAALHGCLSGLSSPRPLRSAMRHAYWGPSCGTDSEIERELMRWHDFIEVERVEDPALHVAAMIADGAIVGWMQGRAEFGPRALGNRSILADPRPAENKNLINAMIKKREAFRPFAPSVLADCADEYFEMPPCGCDLAFMVVTVNVREPYRRVLGAVTHVDGSARIHTVTREANPLYWSLIRAFGDATGIPVLLNTSFNNNAEPIVHSTRDGVITCLTTDIHALVVGNFVVRKPQVKRDAWKALRPSLPAYARLQRRAARTQPEPTPASAQANGQPLYKRLFASIHVPTGDLDAECWLDNTHDLRRTAVSPVMADLLLRADGFATLGVLAEALDPATSDRLLAEAVGLWARRQLLLLPA
jgi:carbamoyltransferase